MGNRREFLRDAIAATTAVALPYACPSFATGGGAAALGGPITSRHIACHAPFLVLIDETLDEAGHFAAAAARLGLPARMFADDAGIVWMRDIEPRLASFAAPLAGLTSAPTSFCLEYLARAHRLRLVYRIEHERAGATNPRAAFRHRLAGPAELGGAMRRVEQAGTRWPNAAAELFAACPVHFRTAAPLELPDLTGRGSAAHAVSWLMAPAA
jgi:hypothetical protein